MIVTSRLGSDVVRHYSSRTFVVALGVDDEFHKLFQIMFTAKDGSFYLTFPYFKHRHGIAADVPLASLDGGAETADLTEHGWKTTHRVKYAHHVGGEAHFSQDNKVYTHVRKQAVPLAEVNGHLFTLYLKGLSDFDPLKRPKDVRYTLGQRTTILMAARGGDPGWFRLVGWWYTSEQFVAKHRLLTGKAAGPVSIDPQNTYVMPDGRETQRALLSPPAGTPSADSVLELMVEGIGGWDQDAPSTLLFLGGFDRALNVDGERLSATYLALKYPAAAADEVWQLMRSIDLSVASEAPPQHA